MRIKLTFRAIEEKASISLNYNYAISALIYKTVAESSPRFAKELHDKGFTSGYRQFRLFTFSRIETKYARIDKQTSRIVLTNPYIKLQVSSPINEFLNNFVRGLFAKPSFFIGKTEFVLDDSVILTEPEFSDEMEFRALSPVTEAVRNEEGDTVFLTPENDWSRVITQNLQRKHEAFYGNFLPSAEIIWTWNKDYLVHVDKQRKSASSLIAFPDKNNPLKPINVRGWLAPFTVKGNIELIKLGYVAGFGNRNSMGFGMAEVSQN